MIILQKTWYNICMRKFLSVLIILCCSLPAFAQIQQQTHRQQRKYVPVNRMKNPPVGTFKKKKDGTIVQYDDKGKKIGEYKLENNNYKKVK